MRVTIIPSDKYCAVDDVGYDNIDMSSVSSDVHAVQWFGSAGWVEFRVGPDGVKPENQTIDSLDQFQTIIDEWNQENYDRTHPPAPTPPTAEENKSTARDKLTNTDWSALPDVNILNKADFDAYRAEVRAYIITPTAGFIDWPVEPQPIWPTE